MKIGLFQIDGKGPNLALMKLAALYKTRGLEVHFNAIGDYNFASCIFTWNKAKALKLAAELSHCILGGYGINDSKLREDAEHIMPDYDFYGIDYSMGYTSRGCIRACPWCVVPKMEGYIRHHASIYEFWNPMHRKLLLLDNNFFAAPQWRYRVAEMLDADLQVCFNQGLDIRLIDHEQAAALTSLKFRNKSFKAPILYFAFDRTMDEPMVRNGIRELNKAGIPAYRLMFYVLVGFDTTFEEDMGRFRVLNDLKCYPYIMVYDKENCLDQRLKDFARWVNRHLYKVCAWEEYKPTRKPK